MKKKGIFITGTDTDVGKTYVGRNLVRALSQQAMRVRVRKPVESGWPSSPLDVELTDAALLAEAAGHCDTLALVCPNPLQAAVSPVRAAELEDKVINLATLKQQCLSNILEDDFLYVEGAGGFYSPLASDGLNADLAQQLALPILLIAEDKLGCINQILLNLDAITHRGLEVLAIVLNNKKRTNTSVMNNHEALLAYTKIPIFSYAYGQVAFPEDLLRNLSNK